MGQESVFSSKREALVQQVVRKIMFSEIKTFKVMSGNEDDAKYIHRRVKEILNQQGG